MDRSKRKGPGEGIPWAFFLAETGVAIGIKRKKGCEKTPPPISSMPLVLLPQNIRENFGFPPQKLENKKKE